MSRRRGMGALACAALGLLWLAPAALIGFGGDFPLNDDWAFARSAEVLAETNRFERVAWMYALAYPHVGAGALALRASGSGEIYETLRLLNWVTGFVALLGAYALIRRLGAQAGLAAFGAAVFAANPLFLNLSFTFMSDVQFAALTTWSLFFWIGAAAGSRRDLALALALAGAAVACRQPGAALLLAFPCAWIATRIETWRQVVLTLGGALAAVAALAILAPSLEPADADAPFGPTRFLQEYLFGPHVAYFLATNAGTTLLDLGLYLAPLAALLRPPPGVRTGRLAVAWALASAAALALLVHWGLRMPLGLNVVHAAGVGPMTLGAPPLSPLPDGLWWAATAIGVAAAGWILASCGPHVKRDISRLRRDAGRLGMLAFVVIYWVAVAPRSPFFDRYLLPILPPLIALLCTCVPALASRAARVTASLLAAGFAVWATLGTHDYLAWNRARWSLIDSLLASGVEPSRVQGGFEFGGRYLFGPSWQFVADDEYVVTFAEESPGRRLVAEAEFRRLLPPRLERVRLFRRLQTQGADSD